jgi:signal transduction histidine kinase
MREFIRREYKFVFFIDEQKSFAHLKKKYGHDRLFKHFNKKEDFLKYLEQNEDIDIIVTTDLTILPLQYTQLKYHLPPFVMMLSDQQDQQIPLNHHIHALYPISHFLNSSPNIWQDFSTFFEYREVIKNKLNEIEQKNLSKMIGTLKHEINNPLAIIMLSLERIEQHYAIEESSQYTKKIYHNLEKIQNVLHSLENMKDITSLQYGQSGQIYHLKKD